MFYAPAQDVQRPTHPRLHVRDARDAHIVFEAVRQGRLKPVIRRLNELERVEGLDERKWSPGSAQEVSATSVV